MAPLPPDSPVHVYQEIESVSHYGETGEQQVSCSDTVTSCVVTQPRK